MVSISCARLIGVCLCLLFVGAASSRAHAVALKIGRFDSTRGAPTSPQAQGYVDLVTYYPGSTFSYTPTLTPSFLSGVDILIISSAKAEEVGTAPLSASEQTAMLNFVKGGGRALIIADGYTPFLTSANSMTSPFGMTVVDDGLSDYQHCTPLTHSHPVINGPFGDNDGFWVYGAGAITNYGLNGTPLATIDATGAVELVAIERHKLNPGSGRVVILGDVTPVRGDVNGYADNPELWLNSIDYLAQVPEPSSWVMGAMGLASLAAVAVVGRKRRQQSRTGALGTEAGA